MISDAVTIVMPAMDKAPNKPHRRFVFDCAKLRTHTSFPQTVGRKLLREIFPSGSTREKFPRLNDCLRDKIGGRFFGCQIKNCVDVKNHKVTQSNGINERNFASVVGVRGI